MIEEPRDPMTAIDLFDLCERLNEWAEHIDSDENDATDYPCDVTSLPTFGDDDIEDTTDVWSWDATQKLVSGPQISVTMDGWKIVDR